MSALHNRSEITVLTYLLSYEAVYRRWAPCLCQALGTAPLPLPVCPCKKLENCRSEIDVIRYEAFMYKSYIQKLLLMHATYVTVTILMLTVCSYSLTCVSDSDFRRFLLFLSLFNGLWMYTLTMFKLWISTYIKDWLTDYHLTSANAATYISISTSISKQVRIWSGAGINEMPRQCRVVVNVTSVRQHIRCGTERSSVVTWKYPASSPALCLLQLLLLLSAASARTRTRTDLARPAFTSVVPTIWNSWLANIRYSRLTALSKLLTTEWKLSEPHNRSEKPNKYSS